MSGLSPIERFFGLGAAAGPLALLDIDPRDLSEEEIHSALRARLDYLDKRPDARTLEADEARLALHAAAAQLLDPTVRAHLLEHHRVATGAPGRPQFPPALTPTPAAPKAKPETPQRDLRLEAFRAAATSLVSRAGGWNTRSMHRVAALAHAMGMTVEDVRAALHMRPQAVRVAAGASPVRVRPHSAPPLRRAKPKTRRTETVAVISVALAMVIGGAMLAQRVRRPELTRAQPPAPPPARATIDTDTALGGAPPADEPEERVEIVVDRSSLFQELPRAVEMVESNPGEAAWRFEESIAYLSRDWWRLSTAEQRIAQDRVGEFVLRAAPGGPARRRAVDALARGADAMIPADAPTPDAVAEAAWSVGALTALANDRDAPTALRLELTQRTAAALGPLTPEAPTFPAGAAVALERVVERLTGGEPGDDFEAVWQRWSDCAQALRRESAIDAAIAEKLHLDAVEALLRRGPALSRSAESRRAARLLLARIDWGGAREQTGARVSTTRLLAWFDDETIDTNDLAVVTEWMAVDAEIPGVGFAMVLPRSAGAETRAAYRDRYADAWAPALTGARDAIEHVWTRAARDAAARTASNVSRTGALVQAIELARLNEAAEHRWRRDIAAARGALVDPSAGVEAALASATGEGQRLVRRARPAWVVAYLAGPQNITGRLEALELLERLSGPLDTVSGDVLAEAALWGTPPEVRRRAQLIARAHDEDPALLNGLLESLPRAPQGVATSEIIEDLTNRRLPAPDSSAWPAAARRALVERLLELLAGQGELGVIDDLRDILAASLSASAGARPATAQTAEDPLARRADDAATDEEAALRAAIDLHHRWRREAERYDPNPYAPISLLTIERSLAGRTRMASGPVQAFVAHQLAGVELMAFVVSAERPGALPDIREVMDDLAARRRGARHVMQQIEAAEHARLRLWSLRFGGDALTPATQVGVNAGGAGR